MSSAPSTGTTVIDTGEMPTVHTFFRRELRLAGAAVRRVPDGDVRRARAVADHLEYVGRALHHHHQSEDELVWPLLLERVPQELAPIVVLMQSQHERIDALLHESDAAAARWRADAAAPERDHLADVLDELSTTLAEHLDAEEQRLLPIAARCLSQEEWEAVGQRARAGTRPSEQLLTFGMIQHDGDPVVVARMLSGAPAPVRRIFPALARRAFRRRALLIHGTATP